MRRSRERAAAVAAALLIAAVARAESATTSAPPGGQSTGATAGGLFDMDMTKSKEPIVVTSDSLEYDYKDNVVVYRGDVLAVQGEVKVRSDTLTVTFANANADAGTKTKGAPNAQQLEPSSNSHQLKEIVAVGAVRIDHGTRWATGTRAVFDQTSRTVVLTGDPVMHDGTNEVAGDKVVVYLDENKSVVEGGRKRVKAVLHPDKDNGLAPPADAKKTGPAAEAKQVPAADDATARATTP